MILHTMHVELGARGYPIYLGTGSLRFLGEYCAKHNLPQRLVVLADRNSARVALKPALASLKDSGFDVSSVVMPPGERQKSVARAKAVTTEMLKMEIPRKAGLVALGGGVVGDVGGFVASTYRRGIAFVQCPTTLLSQVDSSVGGKNGVNHPLSKNAIGTYHQPVFVFSDCDLLSTLSRREVIAGLGEVLKYPIVSDPSLLTYLENNLDAILRLDREPVLEVASRCLRIKSALVSQDEKELLTDSGRVLLNVGHAIGHALEVLSRFRLRHGEAVLLGILAEGYIAVLREGFPRSELDRLVRLFQRLKSRYRIGSMSNPSIVRTVLAGGGARFVLPRALGQPVIVRDVTNQQLSEGLRFLRTLTDRG
ncbi:MAG: 3-dehydroquinate synthase [Ignavibacteriae bacterium]|nr:3-dehydroquinate synthase [Ignavibacteriota bacterium]